MTVIKAGGINQRVEDARAGLSGREVVTSAGPSGRAVSAISGICGHSVVVTAGSNARGYTFALPPVGVATVVLPTWVEHAWHADQGITITADKVSSWVDFVNGVILSDTAGGARRPTLGTYDTKPAVYFDGADSLATTTPITFGTAWTVGCVFKLESTTESTQTLINADTGSNRFSQMIRREGSAYKCVSFNNAGINSEGTKATSTLTAYKIIVVTRDTYGLIRVYEDRVTNLAEAYLAGVQKSGDQTIRLGSSDWFGTLNQYFNGYMLAAYIDPDTAHEWWTLNELFQFASDKWGTEAPSHYAPRFPGIQQMQLRPSDLLDTLAIGDPIDSIPVVGDLAVGAFTASGTARPVLAYDWAGRVVVSQDGINDMLEISGLSVALPVGCTFFAVREQKNTTATFAGLLRADAGSSGANDSLIEEYFYPPSNIFEAESNRLTGYQTVAATHRLNQGTWSTGVQASSTAATRGLYISGKRVAAGLDRPFSTITRMQVAGYSQNKFLGNWHDWIFYNGALSTTQSLEVQKYIEYQHLSSRAISGMPDFVVNDWRVSHLTNTTVDTVAEVIPDGINAEYTLRPTTAATRGTYRIVDGHPCIQFNGTDTVYERDGLDTIANRNYTMVSLWKHISSPADARLWGHDNINSGNVAIVRQAYGIYAAYNGGWVGAGHTGVLGAAELFGVSTSPTGITFRRNGVKTSHPGTSPNVFPSGTSKFGVGKRYGNSFGTPPNGYFFGQWAIKRPLNDAEYLELENWIKSLYPGLFP